MESKNLKDVLHTHTHGLCEVMELMPEETDFVSAASVFSQLCDSTRLRILWILCHAQECVGDIAAAVGMSSPAVSYHLRSLRQCGLIISHRSGKEVLYTISQNEDGQLVHKMIDAMFNMKCNIDL